MGLLSNQNNRRETKTAKSKDLRGKHFVVTGANTGLGYVTTRELAKMGAKVTMACRSAERGQKAADRIRQEAFAKPVKEGVDLLEGLEDIDLKLEIMDLGSLKSIEAFARRMMETGSKVDVLINNAGICGVPERRETADGLEMQIGVNHFGTHLLTRLMEPMISDGGRVVFLSSLGHDKVPAMPKTLWDWDNINYERPNSYHPLQAYGRSKLANVLDTKEFAKRLAGRGINTYAVQPGLVKTEIHRSMTKNRVSAAIIGAGYAVIGWLFLQQPLEGCSTTLMCALDPALADPEFSGKYWGGMKEERPSEFASDPANPPRLWSYTEKVLEAKLGIRVDDVTMNWR